MFFKQEKNRKSHYYSGFISGWICQFIKVLQAKKPGECICFITSFSTRSKEWSSSLAKTSCCKNKGHFPISKVLWNHLLTIAVMYLFFLLCSAPMTKIVLPCTNCSPSTSKLWFFPILVVPAREVQHCYPLKSLDASCRLPVCHALCAINSPWWQLELPVSLPIHHRTCLRTCHLLTGQSKPKSLESKVIMFWSFQPYPTQTEKTFNMVST